MLPTFEDPRLNPIRDKVDSGARLSFEDGLTLYRTPDLLGVGWLANHVREKQATATSPTSTSTGTSIRPMFALRKLQALCAFGRDASSTPKRVHDVRWSKSGSVAEQRRIREGATEFHIVGGLHPESDASTHYLPDAARPEAALPAPCI
jgi:aminodeoxyfutalosine synthase